MLHKVELNAGFSQYLVGNLDLRGRKGGSIFKERDQKQPFARLNVCEGCWVPRSKLKGYFGRHELGKYSQNVWECSCNERRILSY